jgi:hypothetical protein
MRDDEAKSLLPTLRSQPSSLRGLVERAERVAALDRELRQWTQEPWFDSVRLVNVRGDTAILFASSAAVLVPLRYRQQELLSFIRERLRLPCVKLETKVKPLVHTRLSRV